MYRTRWQQHVSSSALVLQLTPHTVFVTWASIIWTLSVMLQLSERFSYPNTLRSQCIRISDVLLNFQLSFHSLQYLSYCWIVDIPYSIRITDFFPTPNKIQQLLVDPNFMNSCCPFLQDCPPSLLIQTWHQISAALTHSISLCLALITSIQQEKTRHVTMCCCPITQTVPHLPEMYVPVEIIRGLIILDGVHYRGVPLYIFSSKWLNQNY